MRCTGGPPSLSISRRLTKGERRRAIGIPPMTTAGQSSKTTTSSALPLHSHFTGNARRRWLWQRCRAQDCSIRDNLQDEGHGYLSFSGDGRPAEPINQPLADFYKTLLRVINASVFREGEWSLCHCTRCRDNATYQNLLSWSWSKESDRYLVVINFSDSPAQGRVQVAWSEVRGKTGAYSIHFPVRPMSARAMKCEIQDCMSVYLPLFSV